MNLNKYTKQELINKMKSLENKANQNKKSFINLVKIYFSQIIELFLTFKNLLLKLTLISLIIQSFKRFRIFRRLWLIINTIVMGIFGISLFENSLFDFFGNILSEFRFISWNVIDYLTNTNFYQYLSNLISKNDTKDVIKQVKGVIIKEAKNEIISDINQGGRLTERELRPYDKSKIADWIKPGNSPKMTMIESEVEDVNYYKYIIITTGIIIVGSVSWYYSDEIKTGAISLWDWINSFRSNGSGGTNNNSGSSSNNNTTPTGPSLPIEPLSSNIELVDNTDKGKARAVITSPSLENLNEQARESWENNSRPISPSSSNSSQETIVPTYSSSSTEILNPLNTERSINVDNSSLISEIERTWRIKIPKIFRENINFIETNFKDNLTNGEYQQIVDRYVDICQEYNKAIQKYKVMKTDPDQSVNAEKMKYIYLVCIYSTLTNPPNDLPSTLSSYFL